MGSLNQPPLRPLGNPPGQLSWSVTSTGHTPPAAANPRKPAVTSTSHPHAPAQGFEGLALPGDDLGPSWPGLTHPARVTPWLYPGLGRHSALPGLESSGVAGGSPKTDLDTTAAWDTSIH